MEDGGGEHRDGALGAFIGLCAAPLAYKEPTVLLVPSLHPAVVGSVGLQYHCLSSSAPSELHCSHNASRHAVTSHISTATRGGAPMRIGTRMEILFIWQPRHDADRTRLRKKSLRKAISNPHPDHPCPGARPHHARGRRVEHLSRSYSSGNHRVHRCASSTPVVEFVGTFSGAVRRC